MSRKRTWLSILLAMVAIAVVLCLALVGGTAYWLYSHVQTQELSSDSAAAEFSRQRARFAGQQPLVEMRPGAEPVVHRAAPVRGGAVTTFHVLAYDPDDEQLIRTAVPMWLLKLAPKSSTSITSGDSVVFGRLNLSMDDIARQGPGLVMDLADIPVRGVRLLIWTD